jgi:hypothetical protein
MPKTSNEIIKARRDMDLDEFAVGVIGTEIVRLGKKGVDYSEAKSAAKAKKDKAKIRGANALLDAFFGTLGARHITKAQILSLLAIVVKANKSHFGIKDVHFEGWQDSIANRIRNLLNHANTYAKYPQQGKPLPKWFFKLNLPGVDPTVNKDGTADDDEDEDEDDDSDDQPLQASW